MMSVPISKSMSYCYSNVFQIDCAECVCIYLFKYRFLCVCVFVSCTLDVHVSTPLSFRITFLMFCFACHTRTSTTSPDLALSSRLFPGPRVWVSRSLLPTYLFEHLPTGQARNPPTQWTTSSAWSVLSCPSWPCRYRMCVCLRRETGLSHRLALAARYGHSTGDPRTKRTVHNKLDFNTGDQCPFDTVVLGECHNAYLAPPPGNCLDK